VIHERKGLVGNGDSQPPADAYVIMTELKDIRDEVRMMSSKLDKVYEHVVSEGKPERGLLMRVRDIEKRVGSWVRWTGIVAVIMLGLIAEKVFEWFTASPPSSHQSASQSVPPK
jgi:hypothetical protein